jgi:hypothetical protein
MEQTSFTTTRLDDLLFSPFTILIERYKDEIAYPRGRRLPLVGSRIRFVGGSEDLLYTVSTGRTNSGITIAHYNHVNHIPTGLLSIKNDMPCGCRQTRVARLARQT